MPDELKKNPQAIGNIHACRNGDVWLITADTRELYRFKKSSRQWIHYRYQDDDPHSTSPLVTVAMFEEEDGAMWFGTLEDGIMRFDEANNRFDFYRTAYTDTSKVRIVNMLRIDGIEKGELYLMPSRIGLIKFRYADSTAKFYRESDGLATESNFDIAIDHDKNIWLACYQEVTQFNTKSNVFTRFHIDYANDNFAYGNVLIVLKNGDVGVSIRDTLAVYKPAMMVGESTLPHVLISDFSVFESSMPFTQKNSDIHLSYKQNIFSISFSAFSDSRIPMQYAYKLAGFDKDWVYCGK